MRVHFLGVRGSTPAPGPEFAGHGGNTSCVAVEAGDGSIRLVLDAGTGLGRLTSLLPGAFDGTILLGHLHWDHTHGLPFARAVDHPDARVTVRGPSFDGSDLESLLRRAMSPPHFPIGPERLRGDWSFAALEPGTHRLEGFEVLVAEIPHKGGLTFGYRVDDGERSLAYLSDHAPQALGEGPTGLGELHPAALALARDVDLLIHDAQYTAAELPTRGAFGHAAAEYATDLAEAAGAGAVALFHHDPARTDDEVDAIVAHVAAQTSVPVFAARESTPVDLDRAGHVRGSTGR